MLPCMFEHVRTSAGVLAWANEALSAPSCRLVRLSLSDCEADNEAAFAIAGVLKPAGSLATLEMASNQFTQPGVCRAQALF